MRETPEYLIKLRKATSKSHERLENLTEGNKLINNPTKARYARLLLTHYLHHLTIANIVANLDSKDINILDWPVCKRIDALQQDLSRLEVDTSGVQVLNVNAEVAFAVGMCYVSEGSCMGNQMMLKALRTNPEFNSWQADDFLSSCKEGFGERWKSFLQIMRPYGNEHYNQLESGGLYGFELFEKIWLDTNITVIAPRLYGQKLS